MADPVVHITNGVPDSGTGNITTLGQTLVDGANATLGLTTAAAVTTDATGTLQQYLRGLVKLFTAITVKAASTAPVATDPALVVAISPNSVNANGSAADANSAPVAFSTEGKASIGSLTETAPATDTASSGLNGRLQRIAQRLTSILAGIPMAVTATASGATASRVNAAATTNATSLKASAGQLYTIDVFNAAAYNVFLKLYNKASAPTVGTDTPVMTIPIQAGGGYSKTWPMGLSFATGIAYAITKLQADSDTTVVVAGDLTGNTTWI